MITNKEQIAIDAMEFFKAMFSITSKEFVGNFDTAISALEKQIPKKPLDTEGDCTALFGSCPNCKNIVCDNEDYKFCNECGQALDWSDTE